MKEYDVVVVGGGISGVSAAVAAARQGLQVLLIEKIGALGGAMSYSLVYPFMNCRLANGKYLCGGIFQEMLERKKAYETSWEYFKLVFDDMIEEAGVDVLFHSTVFAVKTEERQIKSVKLATKSGEMEIQADFFIDTTGDGEVFALAGCDFQLGREIDNYCQPMTTCFRVAGVDVAKLKEERSNLQLIYQRARAEGRITNPREDILFFYGPGEAGLVHFNTTRIIKLDPTNPFAVSQAEVAARKQVYEMMCFLRKNSTACKDMTLVSIANHIGVRESRKLKGVHILTVEELKACTIFDDAIVLGNYDIDIHNPSGTGTSHRFFGDGEYYTIPYRSLLPKEYNNLLVAGRCLSATHEAQASVRIMPTCACLGQAAGTAVAVAFKSDKNAHTVDVKSLQNKLLEKGAVL